MYQINNRQKAIARKLGIQIRPSTNPQKKIDVYYKGRKIPIGARGYMDYHKYKKIDSNLAEQKRRNYYARHKNNIVFPNAGYWAWQILWN